VQGVKQGRDEENLAQGYGGTGEEETTEFHGVQHGVSRRKRRRGKTSHRGTEAQRKIQRRPRTGAYL